MRNLRKITVAISPELYRQSRMVAAYGTNVTAMLVYFLERMPAHLMKEARFPAVPL